MEPVEQTPPIVDRSTIEEVLGPDFHDLLLRLVALLEDEAPALVRRIEMAFASGDLLDVEHGAHKLTSQCGNLGAARAQTIARLIETHARARDLKAIRSLVLDLRPAVEQAIDALKAMANGAS